MSVGRNVSTAIAWHPWPNFEKRYLSKLAGLFNCHCMTSMTKIGKTSIPQNILHWASHTILVILWLTHLQIFIGVPQVHPCHGSIIKWTGEAVQIHEHARASIGHLFKNAATLHDNLGFLLLGDDRCRPRVEDQILQETIRIDMQYNDKEKDWHAIQW